MLGNAYARLFGGRRHRLRQALAPLGGELPSARLGGIQRGFHAIVAGLVRPEAHVAGRRAGVRMRPLRLTWVDNWDPNAVAFELDGTSHVALYGGAATLVAAVASAIARSDQFEPGLAGGEAGDQSFGAVARCFARRWPESSDAPVPSAEELFRPPATPERAARASELVWAAAAFLLFHEATHHRHGHVRLAAERFGAWGIFEAADGGTEASGDRAAAFQAMEVDADATAVRMTLAGLAERPAAGDGLTPAQSLRTLTVAMGVLFNVFDHEQRGLERFRLRRHPHPAVRMASAVVQAVAWADRRAVPEDVVQGAVVTGLRDLEWIGDVLGWSLSRVMREERAAVDAACRELRDAAAGLPAT